MDDYRLQLNLTELLLFFYLNRVDFSADISLRVLVRLGVTIYTVKSVAGMKLNGDHIKVLGLQTNVTFLKVKVKVRVWNNEGQLEHC